MKDRGSDFLHTSQLFAIARMEKKPTVLYTLRIQHQYSTELNNQEEHTDGQSRKALSPAS